MNLCQKGDDSGGVIRSSYLMQQSRQVHVYSGTNLMVKVKSYLFPDRPATVVGSNQHPGEMTWQWHLQ